MTPNNPQQVSESENVRSYAKDPKAIRLNFFKDLEKNLLCFENKVQENRLAIKWVTDENILCEEIAKILPNKKFNKVCFDMPTIPEPLAAFEKIKVVAPEDFSNGTKVPDIVVTEADFAVVETGEMLLLNKEINRCFNSITNLVVIVDIAKMVISRNDLNFLLNLLSSNNQLSDNQADIKIIRTPFKHIENNILSSIDIREYTETEVKITVMLYDNGVTELLNNEVFRETLYCINCGRCAQVCPISAIVEGHSPIDLLKEQVTRPETANISAGTTLCGNCEKVCPVRIPFGRLLIKGMNISKQGGENVKLYKAFSKRAKMNDLNRKINRYFFLKRTYGKNKNLYDYFSNQKCDFFNEQQQEK